MMVLGLLSIVFGLLLLDTARAAFGCDEPAAGLLAGSCGTVFVLLGFRVCS